MHYYFALARYLPYWAFPAILLCLELTWRFHRKARRWQWIFLAQAVVLTVILAAWFYYRGYSRSDEWVRYLLD